MSVWILRVLFLSLSTLGGYAVSQVRPELIDNGLGGVFIGFGFGGLLIAIDEMVKGFSLRAFSAASFGLLLGTVIALLIDNSGLFIYVEDKPVRWLIRLCLFLGFGYIGMILAMRSNKEDFYLIIPFVRFASQSKPENLLVLDTSAIIDGRIAELIEGNFLEGTIVVPRFVLKELQFIADSTDPTRRARGRRGLEMLGRIQRSPRNEVKIHEADFREESEVDAKLVRLARALGAKLITNDYNLSKIAELQSVPHLNMHELARALKPAILPGEIFNLKIVREGKDKGQGVGYLNDGTMVVVNNGHGFVGQQIEIQVQSLVQTGAGVLIFADVKAPVAA
ncbi:MAG: twitching motility protein PilT [Verrucomicrobia bacterium]|nr:MAG: twitching motility protein PilT [Verrucomicrobiota bacterium]